MKTLNCIWALWSALISSYIYTKLMIMRIAYICPRINKKYPSKDMLLTLQSMLNIHLNNPRTPKMVKVGLE